MGPSRQVRPRRLPRSFPNNRRSNGETRSPGTPSASTRGRCSGSARELESDSQSVGKSSSVMTVISNWSTPGDGSTFLVSLPIADGTQT
jgi:hypothetical protein